MKVQDFLGTYSLWLRFAPAAAAFNKNAHAVEHRVDRHVLKYFDVQNVLLPSTNLIILT
jgi:hypothetical protein